MAFTEQRQPFDLNQELHRYVAECTNGSARRWTEMLGMEQLNSTGKPRFESSVLTDLFAATEKKKTLLKSRFPRNDHLKASLHSKYLQSDMTETIMKKFAHRIWGSHGRSGHTRECGNDLDCEKESDRKRIATYLFCWIANRAYKQRPNQNVTPKSLTNSDRSSNDIQDDHRVMHSMYVDSGIQTPAVDDVEALGAASNRTEYGLRPFDEHNNPILNGRIPEHIPDNSADEDYTEKPRKEGLSGKRKKAAKAPGSARKRFKPSPTKMVECLHKTEKISKNMASMPSDRSVSAADRMHTLKYPLHHCDADRSSDIDLPLNIISDVHLLHPTESCVQGSSRSLLASAEPSLHSTSQVRVTGRSRRESSASTIQCALVSPVEKESSPAVGGKHFSMTTQTKGLPGLLQRRLAMALLTIIEPDKLQSTHLDYLFRSIELLIGTEKVHSLIENFSKENVSAEDQGLGAWLAMVQQFSDFRKRINILGRRETWTEQIATLPQNERPAARTSCARLSYILEDVRGLYSEAELLARSVMPILLELSGSPDYMLGDFQESLEKVCILLYQCDQVTDGLAT